MQQQWKSRESKRTVFRRFSIDGDIPYCLYFSWNHWKTFSSCKVTHLCIESGVIAEGSIRSVFEGWKYNRTVWFNLHEKVSW